MNKKEEVGTWVKEDAELIKNCFCKYMKSIRCSDVTILALLDTDIVKAFLKYELRHEGASVLDTQIYDQIKNDYVPFVAGYKEAVSLLSKTLEPII